MKRVFLILTALVLMSMMAYSAYQLWNIRQHTMQEAETHKQLMEYQPHLQPSISADAPASQGGNQSIVDLQRKYPDAVGWLNIPDTRIDYPFAQSENNEDYLYRDLDQNSSPAGTIFMDHRNARDFSDFNTILFGHHMKSGSMFAALQAFDNRAFFEGNRSGTIFLTDRTYAIEFIAFSVIEPGDAVIYDPTITREADKFAFLEHVKDTARYYREIQLGAHDRVVTLSTCNYEFQDARMVLIGRLIEL